MARQRRRDNEQAAPGIGQILRAGRGAMGISLERAEADTGLRANYLAALERDDVDALGMDPAYVRGTLRTYADYLGLDSGALVARHRAGGAPSPDAAITDGDFTSQRSLPRRVARVVAGVVVLVVVAVVAFALGQALAQGSLLPTIAGWVGTVSDEVSARWPVSWSP